ncbi:MAG: hypothetical protein QXG86_00370 [Candidatus Woesearchaeota archaeon]
MRFIKIKKAKKKSQIKIGESVAVLLIFFVLVIMGMIFWSRYSQTSIKEQQEVDIISRAIRVAQTVSFLPELQCSILEVIKFSCFDVYKIEAMQKIIMEEKDQGAIQHYFNSFGFANITIYSMYPVKKEWNIYDFTGGNISGYITTQIPIAIYNPIEMRFSFGYANVAVYVKQR